MDEVTIGVLLCILLLASGLAGCIGSTGDEIAETGQPSERSLSEGTVVLNETVPLDGSSDRLEFPVSEIPTRLRLEATPSEATVSSTVSSVDLQLVAPNGSTVLDQGSFLDATVGASSIPDVDALVQAAPGTWELIVNGTSVPEQAWEIRVEAFEIPDLPPLPKAPTNGTDRPVVAVVDTGANVYHEVFERPSWGSRLPGDVRSNVRILPTTDDGSWSERWTRDRPLWWQIEPFQMYRVPETNLLYASAHPVAEIDPVDGGHGTGVAGTVSQVAPEAMVLVVQTSGHDEMPRVLDWIAGQDWIDIVNLSWADFTAATSGDRPIPNATRALFESGKTVVAAAGNAPVPSAINIYSGPPWVVSAGLWNRTQTADNPNDGSLPDVVTNATSVVPTTGTVKGTITKRATSFAAPRVTGTLARAAGLVLEATGEPPTPEELRRGLNVSAIYPGPTSYNPDPSRPRVPQGPAPAAQMGWGLIDGTRAQQIADCIQQDCTPDPSPQNAAVLEASERTRRQLWT